MTAVVAGELEVLNLFVEASDRRKGYGSRLLCWALADAEARGGREVFLEVRESNAAAICFYEKHGFHQNGRRPHYYQEPEEAALLMSRKR